MKKFKVVLLDLFNGSKKVEIIEATDAEGAEKKAERKGFSILSWMTAELVEMERQ